MSTVHHCQIDTNSTSCLPKLPPHAGSIRRWWRRLRKEFLVSEFYSYTKYHFKSTSAILTERKRHCSSYPSYIIHPFSNFAIYREVIYFFVWWLVLVLSPTTITFLFVKTSVLSLRVMVYTNLVLDILITINVGLSFIIGYHESQTRETVLCPKKIAANYVKTYFLCDLATIMPLKYIILQQDTRNSIWMMPMFIKHFLIYPRSITMLKYFRHVTLFFNIGDVKHEIICVIMFSFFLLHWFACTLYNLQYNNTLFQGDHSSWLEAAGLGPTSSASLGVKYTWCMHMAMSHFYRVGCGLFPTSSMTEYVALSLIMIVGTFYYAYVIVVVLEAVGTANSAEIKYDSLISHLYEYARAKKLPPHLSMRLRLYYECRLRKRYFRERAILATLSDHLSYEIKLHTCKVLLQKVELFKGVSKTLVGSMIGCLVMDVYLANDVIANCEFPTENFYIISTGTVAMVHKSGAEICHFEDGEYFGIYGLLCGRENCVNFFAIEICEIFRMRKADFIKYLTSALISDKVKAMLEKRKKLINDSLAKYDAEYNRKQPVLHQLADGTVIEGGRLRFIREY